MARKGGLGGLKTSFTSGADYPDKRQFVLGSKPPDMYAPRIKPVTGQRSYGKQNPERQANFSGSPFLLNNGPSQG